MTALLTTAQAAQELGVSLRGAQKMIERGVLTAQRVGRDYLITPAAIERARSRPLPGRPARKKRRITT